MCKTAFTVTGACPNDPADVKCCITKQCTNTVGKGGVCLNNPSSVNKCSGSFVKGRCPGPSDVQCCVFDAPPSNPGPGSQIDVSFWIKSFIPLNFEDVTHPWPNHSGKTIINGLPLGGCFVTDQRSFSNSRSASARMHSEAYVKINAIAWDWSQSNRCGQTDKVDCDSGKDEGQKTAGTDDMKFSLVSGSISKVVLEYKGSAGNPLVFAAPKIDMEGTLTVDRVGKYVEFVGKVDDFPAFEAYVSVNGRGPFQIAITGPKPGSGPTDLFGGANRNFRGRVSI
jgi:hypothetical protein